MEIISSKTNNLIKKIRSLSVKKYREQFGLYVIEGEKTVEEALKRKGLVSTLVLSQTKAAQKPELTELAITKVVTDDVFAFIADTVTSQGMLALATISQSNLNDFKGNFLVLDHLQDPGNLGTIIRSGVASGLNNIALIDTVDPFNAKTVRASSGTVWNANFAKTDIAALKAHLAKTGTTLIIAEMSGTSVFDKTLKVPAKFCLAVGNEGNGISAELKAVPHQSIAIPMDNKVESLNAGVSASVLMFVLSNK